MTHAGTARIENGKVALPDSLPAEQRAAAYEAVEIGGDTLLLAAPLDRIQLRRIDRLVSATIHEHRRTLEGLAR